MGGQRSKTTADAAAAGCHDAPHESNNDGLMSCVECVHVQNSCVIFLSSFDFNVVLLKNVAKNCFGIISYAIVMEWLN